MPPASQPPMHYDTRIPIAVFLGPSLDLATAQALLPANYYPPVQLGDIYRLLATGVRMIVMIDGVFHASPPVWQREILAALTAGITVIGTSSMGALRAAELAPYGMIGSGTVYRWYAEGRIEGDDEVALLHTPADRDYRSLSEALVNIRHNLARACDAGILAPNHCADLVTYLKGMYYGSRTYNVLFASPAFARLSLSTQQALQTFLGAQLEDIKRQDAKETLRLCAASGERVSALATAKLTPGPGFERPVEIMRRGVLAATGELIPLGELLLRAAQDQEATQKIVARDSRRFYLLQWMQHRALTLPADVREAFYERWCQRYVKGELASWLAANGLTHEEFAREVADRAAEIWLVEQDPSIYGLPEQEYRALIDTVAQQGNLPGPAQRSHQEMLQQIAVCHLLHDWAKHQGIDCPPEVVQQYIADQQESQGDVLDDHTQDDTPALVWRRHLLAQQALVQWLLHQSPVYFGYDQWSADIAFARTLQITGKIAALVSTWRGERDGRSGDVSLGDVSVSVT